MYNGKEAAPGAPPRPQNHASGQSQPGRQCLCQNGRASGRSMVTAAPARSPARHSRAPGAAALPAAGPNTQARARATFLLPLQLFLKETKTSPILKNILHIHYIK